MAVSELYKKGPRDPQQADGDQVPRELNKLVYDDPIIGFGWVDGYQLASCNQQSAVARLV